MPKLPKVTIYTDGSYDDRTKMGSWAASLYYYEDNLHISGSTSDPTSVNRMELQAVLSALNRLNCSCKVTIFADSMYVVKGINDWSRVWSTNGWKTKSGDVKNRDLWEKFLSIKVEKKHVVNAKWVRGHSGIPENEIVDSLCLVARGVSI